MTTREECRSCRMRSFPFGGKVELGERFLYFAGEQRAIGERMVSVGTDGMDCVGYGHFVGLLTGDQDPWLRILKREFSTCFEHLPESRPRMIRLQHIMVDRLNCLDPTFLHCPRDFRDKVALESEPVQIRFLRTE